MGALTRPRGRRQAPDDRRVLRWAFAASLGGFGVGFNAAVIAGALLPLHREFGLTALEQGALASVLPLGAMAGGLIAGRLAEAYGRRMTLIIAAGVFLAAGALATVAPGYGVVLAARAGAGLAVGIASSAVPLYVSEIAPPAMRGRLVTVNQLMVTVGIVAAYGVGLAFARSGDWRAMFAFGMLPAAAFLYGMLRSPETPTWLAEHGGADGDRARARHAERREMRARELLRSAARPALVIGITLAALQQLSGINAIIYFAPAIMQHTGLTVSNSMLYALIIGVVNVAATVVSIRLVDRLGRRPLLRLSLVGMAASLLLLGLTLQASLGSAESWLALLCILVYIAAFAVGMGPVFWLLIAEIFPPGARATGASVSTATNWFFNFLVGLSFLPVAQAIGQGPTFWLFAAACLAALVFVTRYVPETRGRTFTEIEQELQRLRPALTSSRGADRTSRARPG